MEDQAEYKADTDDALEMLGAGYREPSAVISGAHTVKELRGRQLHEVEKAAFVKLSTAFKSELHDISGNALKVWLFIGLSINRNSGMAFPALRTIAKQTNMAVNTVQNCIAELEGLGLMTVHKGKRRSNLYEPAVYVSANHTEPNVSKTDTEDATVSKNDATVSKNDAIVSARVIHNQINQSNQTPANAEKRKSQTIEEAIFSGQPTTPDMLDQEKQFAADVDMACFQICQNNMHLEPLARAFMESRHIILDPKKRSGHIKALKEMHEAKPNRVKPEHITEAIHEAKDSGIANNIVDLYGIIRMAIGKANAIEENTQPAYQDQEPSELEKRLKGK